jgi:hypothetical protein
MAEVESQESQSGGYRNEYLVLSNARLEAENTKLMIENATYQEIVASLENRIDSQNALLKGYEDSLSEIKGLLFTIRDNGDEQKQFIKNILTTVLEPALRKLQKETNEFLAGIAKAQAEDTKEHIDTRLDRIFGDLYGNSFQAKLKVTTQRVESVLSIVDRMQKKQLLDSKTISDINTAVHYPKR